MADNAMLTENSLEKLFARHCAPALAGIKPSNLFTLHFTEGRPESRELDAATKRLLLCGVKTEILCECERYALVFVYREELLASAIDDEAVRFLKNFGYDEELSLDGKIARLKTRLDKCGAFPHEIGIFLGYPVEDVRGFIVNSGKNYKICGTWKVYGDDNHAAMLFERYKKCTDYFCSMIERGVRVAQVAASFAVTA